MTPARRTTTGLDLDGLFALALLAPLLFIAQLTTLGAAMFALLVPLYVWLRRDRLADVLTSRALLLAIPAIALLSVIWSQAPAVTFRAAVQFGLTILAGLMLSAAPNPRSVARGLTLAFLAYVATAVTAGGTVAIGVGAGGQAVSGLTSSKNLLGDIASTGAIVATACAVMSASARRWIWLGLSLLTLALCIYAVMGARSAGALLGLAIGIATFLGLAGAMMAPKAVRAWLTGVVALLLLVAIVFHRWLIAAVLGLGETLFDKDATLTGRTYLWYRAGEFISEKPALGRGYYAFWRQGDLDAEGLWRYFGIDGRGGFTFHNTFVEILVGVGWVGAVVILTVVLFALAGLVRRFVTRPSLTLVFWAAILVYQLARTPIETIGIAPFYFSTLLMFAGLGAGCALARAPRRAAAPARLRQPWPPEASPLRLRAPAAK